jgi:hypothetical protein
LEEGIECNIQAIPLISVFMCERVRERKRAPFPLKKKRE